MFDALYIGTSGLLSHAKGLRVVGNNLANVNTPGFKGSQLQFSDLVEQGAGHHGSAGAAGMGNGMAITGSRISFRAGLDQATGNPLDLNINGNGFYAVKRDGELLYTRSGDFQFDEKGTLVNGNGDSVQGLDSSGHLVNVTVENLARSLPKATSTVKFAGNITSTTATPAVDTVVSGVPVFDANGVNHPIKVAFKDNGGGDYTVTVTDDAGATLTTGSVKFIGGFPTAATSSLSFNYTPAGVATFAVKLDFSANVTSLAGSSSLAMASQDGYAPGVRVDQSIGSDGTLNVHYSNGQSSKGARLALADFQVEGDLEPVGGSTFRARTSAQVRYGYAGQESFGTLASGHREGSNVDMAEEFSNLIVMQRGYQASSHVVSTANEMIQELFDMKGHR
jgi:flagellar hook protein FlgE